MTFPIVFAVAGDIHGNHGDLISRLERWNEAHPEQPLAFILQVGDFGAIRSDADLQSVVYPTARRLGDFHRVVSGELRYPAEVIFVGGNHEPYGWLEGYGDGGELVPGIVYLGWGGRIERAGLWIVGLSGILSPRRYEQPLPEGWLARATTLKEPTYFRRPTVERLLASGKADILLTHDWPADIYGMYGNMQSRLLLETLRPRYHFAGHIHRPLRKRVAHPRQPGKPPTYTEFVGLNYVGEGPRGIIFMGWDGQTLQELGWDEDFA